MCRNIEDSDMKIVGAPLPKKEEGIDAIAFIEEAKKQRFNGNSSKAKALGSNIVSAFTYKTAPDEVTAAAKKYGIEIDDTILLQLKILSVFSAEYCIDNCLPSPMLSTVAVCELYDVLEQLEPEFYLELSKSLAFSFYYMCITGEGDTDEEVGRQFAMLCGRKGDEALSRFGTEIHKSNADRYKKAIRGFAFV